ncbi:hypothetical protein [Knoellia subterranea]|uniref:Uncharacterized protein n=1 Tax=Knoellia subterranea KCTC 19937 TaxID=1385521 RepID=A0A0A0JGB0_9MICO|nr:hypothetical protein [Knoellia subterranea]KGN36168.1 hypothetical protein N803_06155 [Knoellia subterranea KCTC 19937]
MSSVSKSVADLKADLATLRTYVKTIHGDSHGVHTCAKAQVQYVDGFRPASGHSWREYKDQVEVVAAWVEKYVDDSGWVDALERRSKKWRTAVGHASDATEYVESKKLPAVDSWKGPAGRAYREVVPKMQAGASTAQIGATLLKTASRSISDAGETFFSDVASAVSTLATSLTHYEQAGPLPDPDGPPRTGLPGAFSCGLTHETDDAGTHPWTAMTACETALTALEDDVERALQVPLPVGPEHGGESIPSYLTDSWPKAPGQA